MRIEVACCHFINTGISTIINITVIVPAIKKDGKEMRFLVGHGSEGTGIGLSIEKKWRHTMAACMQKANQALAQASL